MHLFYYQQGLFGEETPDPPPGSPQNPAGPSRRRQEAPLDGHAAGQRGVGAPVGQEVLPTAASANSIRALQQLRDELQWKLETGALRNENEALEDQVLRMQEDFVALQEKFKDMKESFAGQLGTLDRKLEVQQSVTSGAQKRVICTEDLIRFFEEQRRLMAGHWKAQCQLKDEHIRALNLKLTEYTIDFKLMKQTEASLSHEFHCLQDRHGELRAEHFRRRQRREKMGDRLAANRELAEQSAAATPASSSSPRRLDELEACSAGLRDQLQLLEDWRVSREADAQQPEMPWPHSCIWRDELDVREGQLEKITSQLDRTNNALHAAQAALAAQRLRHEEMKRRHRDAEAELREDERVRARWRRECLELRRAEDNLRQTAELQFGSHSNASRELAHRQRHLQSHGHTSVGAQALRSVPSSRPPP